MDFEIVGSIADAETIAAGSGIRELARLRKHAMVEGGGGNERDLRTSIWMAAK